MKGRRRSMLLALLLDTLGEPPTALHPVAYMGRMLQWLRGRWRGGTPQQQWAQGAASWLLAAVLSAGVAVGAASLRLRSVWLQALLLKPLFARHALLSAVREVEQALLRGQLDEARRLLSWHLVSRDTSALTASEVAGACIESLAENLSDSVTAPLLMYQLGGLPLAAAYRLSNTADAMWGYRTPELEYAGKAAARIDDGLNVLPARLTALCVLLAARGKGWRVWAADRRRTPSPNAGHPMSAFAGALGLRLDKRGVYVLNAAGRSPAPDDIARARRLAAYASLWLLLALLLPWR